MSDKETHSTLIGDIERILGEIGMPIHYHDGHGYFEVSDPLVITED